MLCSRLIKRTHLSLYLKNLQQLSSESRCLFIVTEGSSKTFTDSINGFQRNLSGNIWLSNFKRQLSTKSLYQIYGSSAFAAKNGGRSCALPHFRQFSSSHLSREQKSRKMLIYLSALVVAMVGSSYAAVPLYRRFCQATGYGGTIQRRETVEEKIARHDRDNTVATSSMLMLLMVRVKPGESALAFYTAENKSSTPIVGVSTYNVTPMKAAVYFNKIQCFCFEEQRLLPGEQIDMPVFFYIDPEFESDRRMDGINNIILSYTFFKVSEE
ncbi:cytochrome c oxidase assembly protein COX11, mitochondrial isoform X2 [Prosopis cineraria]|uniref:cytochrome c oxidase assembly protein COX11, mitochondrial isoform X2 n=1 Tax=Prosopis cineraria TaxID=364024 RepID=UPI00240F2C79|nr:cytochrome c oxidase assembly protein COX11, mitochondrial isoform X2 [Prosopis cineraria]